MIKKLEITGVHFEVDDNLHDYVLKKLGNIDKYIPKHSRESAHLEVSLSQLKIDRKIQVVCEITLYMPHEIINLKEPSVNAYAAIDILKTKLKQSIQKYKNESMNGKKRRHLVGRLRHKIVSKLAK